jgi:hypothetical protein
VTNRKFFTTIIILEVLALLISLVHWLVFPGWSCIAAWLTLLVAVLLGIYGPIKDSISYVDHHSTPTSAGSRLRHNLALIISLMIIPVIFIAMNLTFTGYVANVFIATFPGHIDCTDSSGRFVMCPETFERWTEYHKNQIIREEGYCYSQLASRLNINSGSIEDLIIGYCLYRPPRCDSSLPLHSRPHDCPPPP